MTLLSTSYWKIQKILGIQTTTSQSPPMRYGDSSRKSSPQELSERFVKTIVEKFWFYFKEPAAKKQICLD